MFISGRLMAEMMMMIKINSPPSATSSSLLKRDYVKMLSIKKTKYSITGIIKTIIIYTKQEEIREFIMHLGSSWRTDDLNDAQLKLKKDAMRHLSYAVIGKKYESMHRTQRGSGAVK